MNELKAQGKPEQQEKHEVILSAIGDLERSVRRAEVLVEKISGCNNTDSEKTPQEQIPLGHFLDTAPGRIRKQAELLNDIVTSLIAQLFEA